MKKTKGVTIMPEQNPLPNKPFESWFSDEAREHYHTARKEMREGIKSLLPPEYREHHDKARKEILLAWRSMIDGALSDMEKHSKKPK
jgi:hypothetical protein